MHQHLTTCAHPCFYFSPPSSVPKLSHHSSPYSELRACFQACFPTSRTHDDFLYTGKPTTVKLCSSLCSCITSLYCLHNIRSLAHSRHLWSNAVTNRCHSRCLRPVRKRKWTNYQPAKGTLHCICMYMHLPPFSTPSVLFSRLVEPSMCLSFSAL
jgi:hypothetical protein